MSFSLPQENQERELESNDESGVTAIVRRYRGDPGSTTAVPGDPHSGAGKLLGSDLLGDADMGIEDWDREYHPDAEGDQPILAKTEGATGLQAAEEVPTGEHTENSERLPGSRVELFYPNGDARAIANAELVACRTAVTEEADE